MYAYFFSSGYLQRKEKAIQDYEAPIKARIAAKKAAQNEADTKGTCHFEIIWAELIESLTHRNFLHK